MSTKKESVVEEQQVVEDSVGVGDNGVVSGVEVGGSKPTDEAITVLGGEVVEGPEVTPKVASKEARKRSDRMMDKKGKSVVEKFREKGNQKRDNGKPFKYGIKNQDEVLRFKEGFNWIEFWLWVLCLALMLFLAVLIGGASVVGSVFLIILMVKLRIGVTKAYVNKQLWKISAFYLLGILVAMWVDIVMSSLV